MKQKKGGVSAKQEGNLGSPTYIIKKNEIEIC
jgi:hypothetical protein